MVARGAEDMEAETLRRIRDCFPNVPVMAVLDLHANFSAEACAHCDAVVGYRTYPHIDMADCGREAAALMRRALAGERFITAYVKLDDPVGSGHRAGTDAGLLRRAEGRTRAAGTERVTLLPGVLADVADNVGGGSPGDGTMLLAELAKQGVARAVVIVADGAAVASAIAAGAEAHSSCR